MNLITDLHQIRKVLPKLISCLLTLLILRFFLLASLSPLTVLLFTLITLLFILHNFLIIFQTLSLLDFRLDELSPFYFLSLRDLPMLLFLFHLLHLLPELHLFTVQNPVIGLPAQDIVVRVQQLLVSQRGGRSVQGF